MSDKKSDIELHGDPRTVPAFLLALLMGQLAQASSFAKKVGIDKPIHIAITIGGHTVCGSIRRIQVPSEPCPRTS